MTVRIGFLGTGYMGQLAHLHSFSQVESCEIVALAEVRAKLGRRVAARYHVPTVYGSHRDLLGDAALDAVIASQPYHRNIVLGREVLESGKHLFTEKPMAANSEDARALVEAAKKRDLVYAVGFMKRHDPGILLARKVITGFEASGELGSMRMIDTTCFHGDWLQNPGQPIRTEEVVPDDGLAPRYPSFLSEELHDAYDHFLNIFSHTTNLLHFLRSGRDITCESAHRVGNSFLVALRSDDVLVSLRGTPSRSHQWEEATTVHFEKGRVEVRSATPLNRQKVADVSVWREIDGTWSEQRLFAPVEWAFLRHAEAFVAAVGEGAELSTRGEACLADVELMEEIFRKIEDE
jgi:predicted dehydrogenase